MIFYPDEKNLIIDQEWTKILRKHVFHLDYRGFARINRVNRKIYIGMSRTNLLLEIEESNIRNYNVIRLEMDKNTIYDVFSDNNSKLWITTFNGEEIYEYDVKNGNTIQIRDSVCAVRQKYIILQNEKIFVISAKKENKNIGIINGANVELYCEIPPEQKIIEDFRFDFNIINGNMKWIENGGEVFQCPVNQTSTLWFKNGKVRTQEFPVNFGMMNIDEVIQERKTYTIDLHGRVQETGITPLYSFINSVKKQERKNFGNIERCGKAIYQKCLN